MSFQDLQDGQVDPLLDTDGLEESTHQWSQREIDALTLAQAARRPLLLRGEPGTGKTQLARAAALHLGWQLLSETIHPRFEASDLVYRHDAVRRLADAQARKPLKDAEYWHPGALWQAYDWVSAVTFGHCRGKAQAAGHVILIDEIDKADSDLPNSLLEVLGQRRLSIPPLNLVLGERVTTPPLILITTNEERELPPAFVRRCVVLNLDPDPDLLYQDWLVQRGQAHFGVRVGRTRALLGAPVLLAAAEQLVADRQAAVDAGLPQPGPAEYLDLLRAIHELAPHKPAAQRDWLRKLNAYAFVKNALQPGGASPSQRRPVVTALQPTGSAGKAASKA